MHRLASVALATAVTLAAPGTLAAAQSAPPPQAATSAIAPDSLVAFVKAHVAVGLLREKAQAEMAEPKNKKPEEQERIKAKLRDDVASTLRSLALSLERFDALTRLVSADDATRKAFESELLRQTGGAKP